MKGALDNFLSLSAVLANMEKLTVTHSQVMRVPHRRLIMLALWSCTSASRIVRNWVFACLLVFIYFFQSKSHWCKYGRRAIPSKLRGRHGRKELSLPHRVSCSSWHLLQSKKRLKSVSSPRRKPLGGNRISL